MIELEKTYLARRIPENIGKCRFKEIIDTTEIRVRTLHALARSKHSDF